MNILIRGVGKYLEVTVKDGTTTLELGLLDKDERITLASTLSAAVDELLDGLEDA
jgi:hypothetical protein